MQDFAKGILNVIFFLLAVYYVKKISKESYKLQNDTIKLIDSYSIKNLSKNKEIDSDDIVDEKIDNLIAGYKNCKRECIEFSIISIILGLSLIIVLGLSQINEIAFKICTVMYIIAVGAVNRYVFEMLYSYKKEFIALENLRKLLKEELKKIRNLELVKNV